MTNGQWWNAPLARCQGHAGILPSGLVIEHWALVIPRIIREGVRE
jgi:hypothetical protein